MEKAPFLFFNDNSEVIILRKLPPIGARIVKSSVAVALCMIVYYIRILLPIGNGIPFYSALAALWCMQPYADKRWYHDRRSDSNFKT